MSECYALKRKAASSSSIPGANALVTHELDTGSDFQSNCYKPFISKGFVGSPNGGALVPITILRDTGASQSLLLEGVLCVNETTHSGTRRHTLAEMC
jgi:hypothetical protein